MRPKNNKNNKNNKNYIKEIIQKSGININNYFKKIKPDVKRLVLSFPNVKFNLIIKTIYSKPIATSKKIERHYNSGFIKLHAQNEFNEVYNSIIEKYKVWEEEHQGKESGLIFNEIENTEVKVVRVKSLNGSSYFDLGIKFNSLLNIQNNDNQCFAYSVIAGILYKLKENPDINKSFSDVFLRMNKNPARVSNYKPFLEMINMENIESPVSIDSIKTFEKQNENIAINVFGIENELLNVNIKNFNKSSQENNLRNIYPMYRSKLKEREYVIDLLYVTQNDSEDNHQLKKHFCLIKDFNAYLNHNHHKRYHCRNCITASYTTENALRKHIEDCFKKEPIKFKLPGKGSKCKFENHHFKLKLPFVCYADFEAVNIKLIYLDVDLRKQINKLKIKSKSHNVNSKIKNMIITRIIKDTENSKKECKRIYHNYINNQINEKAKIYIDKIKEKYITKYFNKLIDNIFDKWIEDGGNIEVSDYEINKYYEINNEVKVKKLTEKLKEKIKRENIKLSFKDNTIKLQQQVVVSYNLQIVSQYPDIIPNKNINYAPSETAEKDFIETCLYYNNRIRYAYYNGKDLNLSEEEKEELYENYNNCYLCNIHLEKDEKIIEHNHLTGEIRGISCKSCNRKESRDGKQLPIFFHNGSGYDFHFITEELLKHETEYNKVKVLPKDTENYISITFGDRYFKLVFKDSMRFLLSSIDNLSKTLKDDQYKILKRELSDDGLFEDLQYHENNERSFKGIFPYDYFNSLEKLKDKSFPSKKEFYSILYQKDISEKEYEHGKKIFERYCKTFKDYLMLYQKLDVLILTDVFENFRDLCLKHYEIDPAYCYSAPGLSWNAGLKKTEIELELLHDKDMLDMFTDGIRGGFSGVLGQRFVKANNKYITNNSEEIKNPNYVVYTDANNLYACGMSDKLPYKNFNWEEHENQDIDYYLEKCNEEVGMVFKVDLESDLQTKYKLRKFPPMPISRVIDEEEISDYSRDFLKQHNNKLGKVKKLILDLHDKKEYIVHYDILKYYISLGIKVTKIHSIISFNHKAWLKDYIDFNTSMRAKATNDFEKDFWKLMNNSFYGKTMENISNRCIIELINKPEDLKRLASKDNFKDIIDFNNDFKAVQLNYKSMYFNKPIYLGMCILDYSKLVMYKFYYDVIEKYLPDNEIIFSDTDSMVLNIFTEDVYKDLEKIKDHLDTSNYPKDHFLYSTENKKVIGKFKDELSGNIITEFIAIRSKVYGYEYLENSSLKFKCVAKGVNKSTKKDFSSESYRDCLFNKKVINKTMFNLVHKKHKIYLNEMTKIGLSPFDDKRYICNNGIDTQPYGIESLYFT